MVVHNICHCEFSVGVKFILQHVSYINLLNLAPVSARKQLVLPLASKHGRPMAILRSSSSGKTWFFRLNPHWYNTNALSDIFERSKAIPYEKWVGKMSLFKTHVYENSDDPDENFSLSRISSKKSEKWTPDFSLSKPENEGKTQKVKSCGFWKPSGQGFRKTHFTDSLLIRNGLRRPGSKP